MGLGAVRLGMLSHITLVLGASLVVSCQPSPVPAPVTTPSRGDEQPVHREAPEAASQPQERNRGLYVGANLGVEYGMHPEMSNLSLPDGMKRRWSLDHADGWRLVVAEDGEDLVVLMTDREGVVTDDVTIQGAAPSHRILHDCGDDVVPSLVSNDDCANDAQSAVALRAWYPRGSKLVAAQEQIRCFCPIP